jgi:hypothetical protein
MSTRRLEPPPGARDGVEEFFRLGRLLLQQLAAIKATVKVL